LLTEDPVVEPDVIDLGTIYAEEEIAAKGGGDEDDGDADIDWDDCLYLATVVSTVLTVFAIA
jgi:hypothetical protein